jgi:DNA-binding NtrC family response regulator
MARRVLLVDDDPDVVVTLREILEREGYEVTDSASGGQAVVAMVAVRPHVVLLDATTPGVRGSETLAYLREHHPAVPVVVISEDIQQEAARRARPAGVFEIVGRPFDFGLLRRLVAHAMTLAPWD